LKIAFMSLFQADTLRAWWPYVWRVGVVSTVAIAVWLKKRHGSMVASRNGSAFLSYEGVTKLPDLKSVDLKSEPTTSAFGRRVLVIGSSGVGKSSIIRLLTGNREISSSDSADGRTFAFHSYKDVPGWEFVDSAGLNESLKGAIPAREAAKSLAAFARANEAGFSLILLVRKRGSRLSESDEKNFTLVQELFGAQVPIAMVITHCELDNPMDSWWQANSKEFTDRYNWKIASCASVCAVNDQDIKQKPVLWQQPLANARSESKTELFRMMKSVALEKPNSIQIQSVWTNSWKTACDFFGFTY